MATSSSIKGNKAPRIWKDLEKLAFCTKMRSDNSAPELSKIAKHLYSAAELLKSGSKLDLRHAKFDLDVAESCCKDYQLKEIIKTFNAKL